MLSPYGYWPLPPAATPSWPGGTVAPSDLTWMQAIQVAAQPETAVVSRPSRVADAWGGQTETWATVTTTTCRISPANSQREMRIAEALGSTALWRLTFPYLTDVQHTDRVAVSGRTLEVQHVDLHSWQTAVVALCSEAV